MTRWSRRNGRVTLRWLFVLMTMFGLVIACAPQPTADTGGPAGVRIQEFDSGLGRCVIATHDTMQGASIAMWCGN